MTLRLEGRGLHPPHPLFPNNLLNFAFGLTGVKLPHYIVASFIFMLPACIASILLSSSLLEALKGNISPAFLLGLGPVIVVSLIPLFYNRSKQKKGHAKEDDRAS